MINIKSISKGGKAFYLAYDQGFEHGPEEFDDSNVDPLEIIRIAKLGGYNGLIVHKGIADKYHKEIIASKVPLILKLNGKTNLSTGEPISRELCTVKEALKLGAKAVGYTIYIGSEHEPEMFSQFSALEEEAHALKMPVILWAYPRGKAVAHELARETLAYAARIGLELGADMIKLKYNGHPEDMKWIVKSAGKAGIVVAGGSMIPEQQLFKEAKEVLAAGVCGFAVGRNVWQRDNPLAVTKKLHSLIWK